jgi:hypothetical protein
MQRTTLTGWRRLGYHVRTVTGDLDAFDVSEYGGRGLDRFTDFGYVRATGLKVFGVLNFDLNVQDSRFQDPQANRFSVDYEGGGFFANAGDIRGSLGSVNPHARFERSLTGVQAGYKAGRVEVKAMRSQARGQARTVSIPGNNSAGPYYLQASQIVRGSERILVDGEPQTLGEDYTIDYELGAVNFVNRSTLAAKIIPPTSTIVATYEAFNFGGASGLLEGASASYDTGRTGKVGVTAMRQRSGGSGQGSSRLERFQGFGPPSTPYVLQFEPVSILTVVVRVDGRLQQRDVDYRFDAQNPAVFFMTRFVPSTSTIDVLYTPKGVSTLDGDRSVVGVDYTLPLGRAGRLVATQTVGESSGGSSPSRGTARSADLRYSIGKLDLGASARDVPIGFVGIETVGFERNERSADLRALYRPAEGVEYDALYRNGSISTRSGTGSGSRLVSSRLTRAEVGYASTPAGGVPLRLRQARSTGTTPRGVSTVDTTTLGTSYNHGRWTVGLDAVNRVADGPFTVAGAQRRGKVESQGMDLRLNYNGGERQRPQPRRDLDPQRPVGAARRPRGQRRGVACDAGLRLGVRRGLRRQRLLGRLGHGGRVLGCPRPYGQAPGWLLADRPLLGARGRFVEPARRRDQRELRDARGGRERALVVRRRRLGRPLARREPDALPGLGQRGDGGHRRAPARRQPARQLLVPKRGVRAPDRRVGRVRPGQPRVRRLAELPARVPTQPEPVGQPGPSARLLAPRLSLGRPDVPVPDMAGPRA